MSWPGLVVIKCSTTIIGNVASAEIYKHLEIINERLYLKKRSPYYFQIQGQTAITGRQYYYLCFFIQG